MSIKWNIRQEANKALILIKHTKQPLFIEKIKGQRIAHR